MQCYIRWSFSLNTKLIQAEGTEPNVGYNRELITYKDTVQFRLIIQRKAVPLSTKNPFDI